MSLVTGFYLQFSCCEDNGDESIKIDAINKFLEEDEEGQPSIRLKKLWDLSDMTSGSKNPQVIMLAAGFNYLSRDTLKRLKTFLYNLDWYNPREVVMVTTHENDDEAKVWRPIKETTGA